MSEQKPPEMPDDEAPPTEEEVAASNRLRDALDNPALDNPDADLARALHAAWSPDAIDAEELQAITEGTIEKEELAAAEALRDALASNKPSADADLVRALAAAWSPRPLSDADHHAIVMKAIGGEAKVIPIRPRGRVVRIAFGITTAIAIAAGFVVLVKSAPTGPAPELAKARSTQPLFNEPFKANPSGSGEASARIDRIALARASDYRDNRFAKWGVK